MKTQDPRVQVVYVGDRSSVGMEWNQRRWVFQHSKPVWVPGQFAEKLLAKASFLAAEDVNRTLHDRYPSGGTILLRRWGALGDLLMFRAAFAAYRRQVSSDTRAILRCQERYVSVFSHDPVWSGVSAIGSPMPACDGEVSFDQVAEADRRGVHEHRVTLFSKAMSKDTITIDPDDWKIPIPESSRHRAGEFLRSRGLLASQRDGPLVAVQVRGSGNMKTLPPDAMRAVITAIVASGASVLLIEQSDEVADQFIVNDRVHSMPHADAVRVMAAMEHADLVVCMDSGALWMAHVVARPTLAILGPTRPAQRITMHPLYPDMARAVCLNEIINCPACFESAVACKGRYTCMRDQPDWSVATRLIMSQVESMLAGNTSLPVAQG